MSAVRNRVARLEQVRGDNHPRFLIVHGVANHEEALTTLGERGVAVGQKDMVDWLPGTTPPTVEVIPLSMPFEDALALLDVEGHATSPLKTIKGNQDAGAR